MAQHLQDGLAAFSYDIHVGLPAPKGPPSHIWLLALGHLPGPEDNGLIFSSLLSAALRHTVRATGVCSPGTGLFTLETFGLLPSAASLTS